MRVRRVVMGMLVPLWLAVGEAGAQPPAPLETVVTTGMIGDVARRVGGDCVTVTAIMGPGVDPHLYQASARDVATLQEAEMILYSGYSLEGQLGEVLGRFAEIKPTLAVAPSSIEPTDLISVQDVYGIDPHLWMDVSLWARTLPTLAKAISEARPACEAAIQANAEAYGRELEALHAWIGDSIATIPEAQRILVTAHDAFNYYGRAYGIEVAGIQGISTETETGVADIRAMTEVVVEREVPAVFIESTINPRTVQAVIDAARRRGQQVEIGGQLYSDAMGEAGTADGTYIGMLYTNTRHIVEALGGTPAPLPEALGEWAERWDVPMP
ncbi:metal ABC transporter solute-binding protein, Zn/Mn family [Halomonas maura]|uniref:metal ABC transporter solute-binding protein, Zn/Mn family n=1 Tax=Halomonas maura TaxID=117606 RepID=UPI0025B3462C|nr:zinc ABC transporter substrate-binding protein [Halomonas maura]MDN3556657.1 zinc ABC transporter substrate-binding protein [Halomonas maura]